MLRCFIAVAAFLSAASAQAGIGPPIAYVKVSGTSKEVWLSNPDGTGAKRLYSGPSKAYIGSLSIRPGGGQIAFKEGQNVLRIIDYDASGNATAIAAVPQNCVVVSLDYHPTDGSILYASNCNGGRDISYKQYNGGTINTLLSLPNGAPQGLSWLHDGSGFLWILGGTGAPNGPELRKSSLANPSAWTVLYGVPSSVGLCWVEVAHKSNTILLTDCNDNIRKLAYTDFGATDQGVILQGRGGHYSPDDSQIVYSTIDASYVQISGATGVRNLTAKGTYIATDWQD